MKLIQVNDNYHLLNSDSTKIASTLKIEGIPMIKTYQLIELWGDTSVNISDLSFKYGSLYRDHDVKVQDGRQFGFEEGYEQCLSDEKKFTLDDMEKCFEYARINKSSFNDYLNSNINKTEWEVDVEMIGQEIKITEGYINILRLR